MHRVWARFLVRRATMPRGPLQRAANNPSETAEVDGAFAANCELRTAAADYSLAEVDAPPLRSPSILNSAFQKVMLWSGAAGSSGPNKNTEPFWQTTGDARVNLLGYEGVETQAILALNTHRMDNLSASLVASHPTYVEQWNKVFPGQAVSDELAGLAIAAFERTVLASQSPFQRWLKGETNAMSSAEKRGALVFFGPSKCSECHTGPALNSMAFYALGMPDLAGSGVTRPSSDSKGRGTFLPEHTADYKFKVPQLYNMSDSPFLGHGGTFRSVAEVVEYYVTAIPDRALPAGIVTPQFQPLTLSSAEIRDLTAFLNDGLRDPYLMRYQPKSVPSGGCIPANDIQSRRDLNCK